MNETSTFIQLLLTSLTTLPCHASTHIRDKVLFQNVDWNMISAIAQAAAAIATFAAVLVALHPIFAERKRNKAAAVNLRARILSSLMILRPALDDLSNPNKYPETRKSIFTDAERIATITLENMLQGAIILEAEEHDALTALVANLMGLKAIMQNNYSHQVPDSAKNILKQVDNFFSRLEKSKWLRGKMPDLPWTKNK